jgi:GNAT superfamily N-acetyltransferase
MNPRYRIVLARPKDIDHLPRIELEAGALLAGHAPPSVLSETTSESDFRDAQVDGRLWVALVEDTPVGFALVEMLASDLPHLEEIDVLPQHGRQGIGTALMRTVCDWLFQSGYSEITLTTFRAVRWNMPFYKQLGFEEVPTGLLRPEVAAVVEDEAARGLDPRDRVVMKRRARAPGQLA